MRRIRRCAVLAVVSVLLATLTAAGPASPGDEGDAQLRQYAVDTWASFVAMTDPASGLPADSLSPDGSTSVQTSTTNIGAYLWSAVVARRLRIISERELETRVARTLTTLEHMERHTPSGQFYNWYDQRSGAKLTVWPPTGEPLTPILSSVDNGWLAAGLRVVKGYVRPLAARADALYRSMDFGFYYQPDVNRILFNYAPSEGTGPCCYDTVVSESRIASYIGIANGQLPQKEYFGTWRTFPAGCDYSFQEQRPVGVTRTYLGVPVFEGAYTYAGRGIVPSWGGSAFEALMPSLFVPEEKWGRQSWAQNLPNTVAAQEHHGLVEAGYGYWGFSPSDDPAGGYQAYGVDGAGMQPDGYPSNDDHTLVDGGYAGCPGRPALPAPAPSAYTHGVVTPHASFLGLRFDRAGVLDNLAKLRRDFPVYSRWGFADSVDVQTGTVAAGWLSLDQGIVMAAIGNELGNDVLRRAFGGPDMTSRVKPVLAMEQFGIPRR
ncbi:glucoamylase family protein [Motilibacter peucedani]|nr:glucoamylase family protein [Motilibacter peucedani]